MSEVDVESLLRSALVPIEPSGALTDRLERRLAEQVAAVARYEAPDGDPHVHRAEADRVEAGVAVGGEHRQADQAGRDVHDVVPAVHAEDSEHVVDVAGRAEVRRIEEADDPGAHQRY